MHHRSASDVTGGSAPRPMRDGTAWMFAGAVVGGIGAYAFQIVGTRTLGDRAYAPIAALWTIQYLCWSTALHAVETYVDREVTRGRADGGLDPRTELRLWIWIVTIAAGVGVAAWAWRDRLFGGPSNLALVSVATVVGFGAFAIVRGRLAGEGRFRAYGVASGAESTVRLAAAAAVAAMGATTLSLAWTLPLGALAASVVASLAVPASRARAVSGRDGRNELAPTRPERFASFLAVTTGANVAAQILLAAGPLVVAGIGGSAAEVSVLFVATTAARVPVVIALGGGLSRALPAFTGILASRSDGHLWIWRRVTASTIAAAGAGAAGGALVGPFVIGALFGAEFTPPWWVASAIGGGVLVSTGGMLLNHLAIAAGAERWLPAPWWLGVLAAAAAIALVPGSPTGRVIAGFAVGHAVAFAGLAAAVRRDDVGARQRAD
jgi:hypothetical protein